MQNFIEAIEAQIGGSTVLKGHQVSDKYASDESSDRLQKPEAVLRPASAEALSKMLQAAVRHRQPLVVQGGLTGLCGGAAPQENEVSVSLERLNKIENLDARSMTMTVQAGVTLEGVQNAAAEAGLLFPLDLGARGSCTIGGNIATNAGGNQVIRYGSMRNLVLGLEAVLPDGTIMCAMNTLLKNNAGFDLKHFFIGSEGTLGIVTRAVLRLFPWPGSRITVLCGMDCFEHCIVLLNQVRKSFPDTLNSFEVMWAAYYQASIRHVDNLRNPFATTHKYYALVELCGDDQQHDRQRTENFLENCFNAGIIENAVLAGSEQQSADFWRIRDGIGRLIKIYNFPANFDVGIALDKMEGFVEKVMQRLAADFANIVVFPFGHIGDGNLHLSVSTGNQADNHRIYHTVYQMCADYDASISAEHGIGMMKNPIYRFPELRKKYS